MHGVFGRDGDGECLRVRVADIFRGESDQPSRHIQRILTGLEHPRQPVDGGVGIAVAHRLVQRRDQVVVLLTGLVVEERAVLSDVSDERGIETTGGGGRCRRELEQVERDARVAVRVAGHRCQRLLIHLQIERTESASAILERASQDGDDTVGAERLQHVDFRPGEQRGIHLERRVLRRRADEHDVAGFHAGEEGVLLRLVETMNLVDEQDRAPASTPARLLRLGHDGPDLLDAGEDGAEGDEVRTSGGGDESRQGRFAGTGRSPQDDRLQPVFLDGFSQRAARADQRILAHEFVERAWPHALGERC